MTKSEELQKSLWQLKGVSYFSGHTKKESRARRLLLGSAPSRSLVHALLES